VRNEALTVARYIVPEEEDNQAREQGQEPAGLSPNRRKCLDWCMQIAARPEDYSLAAIADMMESVAPILQSHPREACEVSSSSCSCL
jgi:hypothetical protein